MGESLFELIAPLALPLGAGAALACGSRLLAPAPRAARTTACLLAASWLLTLATGGCLSCRAAGPAAGAAGLAAALTALALARPGRPARVPRWRQLCAAPLLLGSALLPVACPAVLPAEAARLRPGAAGVPDYRVELAEARAAATDAGRPVRLGAAGASTPADGLAMFEEHLVRDRGLEAKSIALAVPDPSCNCHGWVFAGGRGWVRGDEVGRILEDNGYAPVAAARPGDVAVYRDRRGAVVHSGVVLAAWADGGGVTLVESKWGPLGRHVHLAADQPYGGEVGYYRSRRGGHRLGGL